MTVRKTPSLAGGEILSKLTSLFETSDKNLDQVKKSVQADLNDLRGESTLENLAASLYLSAEAGFKKDLNEIGISGNAQAPYLELLKETWREKEIGKKAPEILDSPELAAMDDFISHMENLPKLREVIDSAEPQHKWKALMAGIFGSVPGLETSVEKYLGPLLSAFGLESLIPKKDEAEKQAGKAEKQEEPKNDGEETAPTPQEAIEVKSEMPNSTIFFGDSNTVAMPSKAKDILKINGNVKAHAKSGMSAKWGRDEVKTMAEQVPSPLKNFENAVLLFGTNDLLAYKPEEIIGFLRETYTMLKAAGVKRVYSVTIPPVGDYPGYNKGSRAEETRHQVNQWILNKSIEEGLATHVIDLAAKEKDGGMADNDQPEKLCKNAKSGDGIHFDKRLLATIYQRELEKTNV